MGYIIDGNNVMGQIPGWHRDKPDAQRKLVEKLIAFAKGIDDSVTVVFDGRPHGDLSATSMSEGVRVLYAERGSDADARIAALVRSERDPKVVTVVTSDKALASTVSALGASLRRSGEFRRQLDDASMTVKRSGPLARDDSATKTPRMKRRGWR